MQPHSTSRAGGNAILMISPCENTRASLPAMLAASGWTVYQATDHREAAALLDELNIGVVIADGNWREFLALTSVRPAAPSVIVTAQFADEHLWAEVLNLGGYDVLAQPFDPNEVSRIVQAALRAALRSFNRTRAPLTVSTNGRLTCSCEPLRSEQGADAPEPLRNPYVSRALRCSPDLSHEIP